MTQSWATPGVRVPTLAGRERFAARRAAISRQFPGDVLVVPTGHEKVRANDTGFRFRPGTDFYYLTGNHEPDCVLVMVPAGDGHRAILFTEPNPGKSDATFFTDRSKGELWVGPRLGVPESAERFGLEAQPLDTLPAMLAETPAKLPVRFLHGLDDDLAPLLAADDDRDRAFAAALSELRLIKDDLEIAELRAAIAATKRGFRRRRARVTDGGDGTRRRRRLQRAGARRGQRRRVRNDRRVRARCVHLALDAQRPAHRGRRSVVARCRRGSGIALHGRRHAHDPRFGRLHAGATRDLYAGVGSPSRGVRRVQNRATISSTRTALR